MDMFSLPQGEGDVLSSMREWKGLNKHIDSYLYVYFDIVSRKIFSHKWSLFPVHEVYGL